MYLLFFNEQNEEESVLNEIMPGILGGLAFIWAAISQNAGQENWECCEGDLYMPPQNMPVWSKIYLS